jgi:hypothetical protein
VRPLPHILPPFCTLIASLVCSRFATGCSALKLERR